MKPLYELLCGLDPTVLCSVLLAAVLAAVGACLHRLAERRCRTGHTPPHRQAEPCSEEHIGKQRMDEILTNLKLLDSDELREEILKAGLNCGPITSTTRSTFERKLARMLLEKQGINLETSNANVGMHTADYTQKFQASHSSEDREFGYNFGLNPPIEEAISLQTSAPVNLLGDTCVVNQIHSTDPSVFYAVCPLYEDTLTKNEKVHIYMDKKEALQVMKMLKGSRFKAFHSRDDAEKFAKGICDYYSPSKSSLPLSPVKTSSPLLRDAVSTPETDFLNKEKANSFKSPRTQDLTAKLRKAVERGDLDTFYELIWSNPRYLIGSGDNPTVVQEGCRYNVMHVAAKENQARVSQLLLDTLENPEFMRLMYPDDDNGMLQKRIRYIVDLYLNTPDKMAFDTPLHFACKFGNAEVVNVLCSHPDIIKNPRNKYDQTPEEVICERSKHKPPELKQKIREYLKGHFYVPLLRAEDNSSFPVIGVPCSPEQPDVLSQPKYCVSPKDPLLAVRAFAGPMSPSKADDFRRIWKTPPRERAGYFHSVRKSDPERGEERVGRELAHELDVPWVEYWEFLGGFADLSSQDGLGKLEEYLNKKEESERLQSDEPEICNRYKSPSPSGRSKMFCNSVSVGAFLEDDDEDMSLEEIKNRQNAALKNSSSVETIAAPECIMDTTPIPSSPRKEGSKYCSPLTSDCRHKQDFENRILSPVSNLLAEFEKLSFSELQENSEGSTDSFVQRRKRLDAQDADFKASSFLTRTDSSEGLQAGEAFSNTIPTDQPSMGNTNELPFLNPSSESSAPQVILKTPPKHQSNRATFLLGKEPSKLDNDVIKAVENVEIDAQKYPNISRWITNVQTYSSTERQSWPSPSVLSGRNKSHPSSTNSPGGLGFSTPGRSSPIPGSPGKYVNASDYSSPGRYSPAYASHIQLLRIRNFSDHSSL